MGKNGQRENSLRDGKKEREIGDDRVKAMILAGGKGTRLRPLTIHSPKPMLPLLGKPCIEYGIELLREHGITEIGVTLQFLPDAVRNTFLDGEKQKVKLYYFEENEPLGTAGSVKNGESFLDETFIVLSGDALTDFSLADAVQFHKEKNALVTILLYQVDHPLEYGVVMTDEDGRVIRFLEKPTWSEVFSDWVNTGIYIIEPEVLQWIEPGVEFDFSKDLFPLLMEKGMPIYGYKASGYWSDIGNIDIYRQAQFDLLDGKVHLPLPGIEVEPGIWMEEGVRIDPSVKINPPVFIGKDVVVEKGAQLGGYTILGKGSVIGSYSNLERSILLEGVYLQRGVELNGAVIGKGVMVGEQVYAGEGSIIGDSCKIGRKSLIKAGVKIWPGKEISENVTLHTSLVWGKKSTRRLFGQEGIKGIANVEITPDFAGRVAAAYATLFKGGSTLLFSSSEEPFAALIKEAFILGARAAGLDTVDIGETIPAVLRYSIQEMKASGGIHVRIWDRENHGEILYLLIEFLDASGLPIDRGIERKIENAFFQEDYQRADVRRLGRASVASKMEEAYLEGMLDETPIEVIRDASFKVVASYDSPITNHLVGKLFERLHLPVITLTNLKGDGVQNLREAVRNNKADFGFFLSKDGENLTLITAEGKLIDRNLLYGLQMVTISQNRDHILFGIPVSAPSILENLAEALNIRLIRTKEERRAIMEAHQGNRFYPLFDGVYTLLHLIEYMALRKATLTELIELIPHFHMAKEEAFCPWEEKGRVMRQFMEETKGKKVELLDGIKVYDEGGWVLILPDLEEPVFKVVSQARSEEDALRMAKRIRDQIEFFLTKKIG